MNICSTCEEENGRIDAHYEDCWPLVVQQRNAAADADDADAHAADAADAADPADAADTVDAAHAAGTDDAADENTLIYIHISLSFFIYTFMKDGNTFLYRPYTIIYHLYIDYII